MLQFILSILLVLNRPLTNLSAKILFISAPMIDSHRRSMYPLARNLGQRGHNVTMLMVGSDDRTKIPPAKESQFIRSVIPMVHVSLAEQEFALRKTVWSSESATPANLIMPWRTNGIATEALVNQKKHEFDRFVNEKWDLVLVDTLFCTNGILIALMSNSTWIPLHTSLTTPSNKLFKSEPYLWSYTPSAFMSEPRYDHRKFTDRIITVQTQIVELIIGYYIDFFIIWLPFMKLHKDVSLKTFYSKSVISLVAYPQNLDLPMPQTIKSINFGGYSDGDKAVLQDSELKRFVEDQRSQGTVVIAFGHMVKWNEAPEQLMKNFIGAINRLSAYRVIWQFNGKTEHLGLGKHVMCMSWLPQQALLNHPLTKLFVSHGGLKSVLETINAGVPALVIPFFAEQVLNAYLLAKSGSAEVLPKYEISSDALFERMTKILMNESYLNNVGKLRARFADTPIDLLDFAAFWTEFIVKHKSVKLESWFDLGRNRLNILQYLFIDMIMFYSLMALLSVKLIWCGLTLTRIKS